MTKRAKYTGQYPVQVDLSEGDVSVNNFVDVEPGGLLPAEDSYGNAVSAKVRDDLIANHPDFVEYNQSTKAEKE